jgi:signal transduction histidine kinase
VILDKINELGPEKFVFRTRSAPSVKFDLNHLHFVLDELLANALSFVMPNSPIEVEFFGQDLSIKNKQSRYKSGDQVPVEPFSGVSEDSSEEGKLGLGLYLIQAYCEKNGAKMNHRVNESDEFILTISFKLA